MLRWSQADDASLESLGLSMQNRQKKFIAVWSTILPISRLGGKLRTRQEMLTCIIDSNHLVDEVDQDDRSIQQGTLL